MARKRKERITKGLRFDIFKRDLFTCQYCGRQPPAVVLQIDHIIPESGGGTLDVMNLLTACEDCNNGKGSKRLEAPIRPDADLSWLETQQEIAELKRYQEARIQREAATEEVVGMLVRVWDQYCAVNWRPSDPMLRNMLVKYPPEAIEDAIVVIAPKVMGGYVNREGAIKYLYGILRNMMLDKPSDEEGDDGKENLR